MKKSILAASLSAALCLLTSHSVMAQDISIGSSKTETALDDQVGKTAYTAKDGVANFTGANSDIDYTLKGGWFRGFEAQGSDNSWKISNFNNFTVEFTNPNNQGDSIGLMARDNGLLFCIILQMFLLQIYRAKELLERWTLFLYMHGMAPSQ